MLLSPGCRIAELCFAVVHPHDERMERMLTVSSPIFLYMNSCVTIPSFSLILPKSCVVSVNTTSPDIEKTIDNANMIILLRIVYGIT